MKIYRHPVKANSWADQVRISRDNEKRWIITYGGNVAELHPDTFTNSPRNWTYALWTGIAWANEDYNQREALKQAEYYAQTN